MFAPGPEGSCYAFAQCTDEGRFLPRSFHIAFSSRDRRACTKLTSPKHPVLVRADDIAHHVDLWPYIVMSFSIGKPTGHMPSSCRFAALSLEIDGIWLHASSKSCATVHGPWKGFSQRKAVLPYLHSIGQKAYLWEMMPNPFLILILKAMFVAFGLPVVAFKR